MGGNVQGFWGVFIWGNWLSIQGLRIHWGQMRVWELGWWGGGYGWVVCKDEI